MKLIRHNGNFAECIAKIKKANQRIATSKEVIQERIMQGKDAGICSSATWCPICSSATWCPENWNSIRGEILIALGDYNPLIKYAQEAVDLHRQAKEFFLNDEITIKGKKPASQLIREIAEEDAPKPIYKRRVLISQQKEQRTVIPTKELGEQEEIIFLARSQKLAKTYGEFLYHSGIEETSVYRPPTGSGDLSRGFWLYSLVGNGSDFGGYGGGLDYGDGFLFGVQKTSAEGTSKKISPYTEKQAKEYLSILEGVRNGNLPASKLEKIINLFSK